MPRTVYIKRVDSAEIESRFSTENAIRYDDMRGSSITFEQIKPFLDKLPPREADLLELRYRYEKNQKDIAKIFNVTQGAVSSRLSRARKRLAFIATMPKISDEDIDEDLSKSFDIIELEIMKFMVKTTCQSETAQLINQKYDLTDEKKRMTQVKVRHRFERCINKLSQMSQQESTYRKYHDLMNLVRNNLYMLHEVKLPHFDRGGFAVFSLKV